MQNVDWQNILIGAAIVAAVFVLIWIVFHAVRLTVKSIILLYQLILSFFARVGRITLNSFKGTWKPSFLVKRDSGAQVNISVAPPTHLIYLTILIAGLFEAANTLLDTVPECMGGTSTDSVIPLFLTLPLLAFCAATCVHQYSIYRDLTNAEERSSAFVKLYAQWWIGSVGEYLLRVLVLICLLISSGEVGHVLSRIHWVGPLLNGHPALVVSFGNVAMFCAFLLWNGCALLRGKSRLSPEAYGEIKKRIVPAGVAEVLALILWSSVILLISRPGFSQLAAAAITTTGTLYAASVVWRYGRATARQLCFAAACIVMISILLGFSTWNVLQAKAHTIVAEATNAADNSGGGKREKSLK